MADHRDLDEILAAAIDDVVGAGEEIIEASTPSLELRPRHRVEHPRLALPGEFAAGGEPAVGDQAIPQAEAQRTPGR